jgi:predicted molibdopterin-dependent oxidoreductase YjgC
MIKLLVDNKEIETKKGTSLLQACLDNDIYVPNLCYLESMAYPSASCRLCFTPAVRRLQRSALKLFLSVHHVDCRNCPAHKKCGLQNLAKFLKVGLKHKPLQLFLKETEIDRDHPCLDYYPNRCVLCGKCMHVCRTQQGKPTLTFSQRGFDTVISFYGEKDKPPIACEQCELCVDICPVGALVLKESEHP